MILASSMATLRFYLIIEITNWLRIDCGSQTSDYDQNGLLWQTDEGFIRTGENKVISPNSQTQQNKLRTLRVFKEQNKNCYILPAPTFDRYFIRATFHYGNYDGLSNPPTFDLELDGNKLITIETSLTETIFQEVMYTGKGTNFSVCLARTQDTQFPFISLLEAWAMPGDTYSIMSKDKAWIMGYRNSYGGSDFILGYPDDRLNRIWTPMTPSDLKAVKANFTSLDYTVVNEPPDEAIIHAVESELRTQSIILRDFNFDAWNRLDHVEIYFTEINQDASAIRKFDLFANGDPEFRIVPQYQNCTGYMITTTSFGPLIVTLIPTLDSTLPPIISAIEVYTAIDSLVTTGTSQDDLDGLAVFINSLEQLKGWSGEPCLPSDTVWQWLSCTGYNPPRVTSINLTGYGLSGPLPDFSKMQALETIDLSNNSLDGSIPAFLGNLPSLRLLDLRDNNFSGDIPESMVNNRKLTYYIDGNQNLHQRKEKDNLALIVGLAVGIPLIVIIVIAIMLIVYFSKRKRPTSIQEQATEMEMGGGVQGETTQGQTLEESSSVSISTEVSAALNGTSNLPIVQQNENSVKIASGKDDASVSADTAIASHPSALQDNDEEELNELLQQHGSSGAHGRA